MTCTAHHISFGYKIKKNLIGGVYGEEERCVKGFGGKT